MGAKEGEGWKSNGPKNLGNKGRECDKQEGERRGEGRKEGSKKKRKWNKTELGNKRGRKTENSEGG